MNKPDWKDAPKWARWLAQNGSGEWMWYKHKPNAVRALNMFCGSTECEPCKLYDNWESTLEKRPPKFAELKVGDWVAMKGTTQCQVSDIVNNEIYLLEYLPDNKHRYHDTTDMNGAGQNDEIDYKMKPHEVGIFIGDMWGKVKPHADPEYIEFHGNNGLSSTIHIKMLGKRTRAVVEKLLAQQKEKSDAAQK